MSSAGHEIKDTAAAAAEIAGCSHHEPMENDPTVEPNNGGYGGISRGLERHILQQSAERPSIDCIDQAASVDYDITLKARNGDVISMKDHKNERSKIIETLKCNVHKVEYDHAPQPRPCYKV